MSTPSKIQISPSYPVSQVFSEIEWIDRKIQEVRETMKRRPSKHRHLADLIRQRKDRELILDAAGFTSSSNK